MLFNYVYILKNVSVLVFLEREYEFIADSYSNAKRVDDLIVLLFEYFSKSPLAFS